MTSTIERRAPIEIREDMSTAEVIAELDARAAAQDLGTCPTWCIGAEHPDHDAWCATDDEFWRFHVGAITTEPVRVRIQQFEIRRDGKDTVEPPAINIVFPGGHDQDFAEAEARQFAAALVYVAEVFKEAARKS